MEEVLAYLTPIEEKRNCMASLARLEIQGMD
jgi:hypothetical protein